MTFTLVNEISNNHVEDVMVFDTEKFAEGIFKAAKFFIDGVYDYLDVYVKGGMSFQMQHTINGGVRVVYFNGKGTTRIFSKNRIERGLN